MSYRSLIFMILGIFLGINAQAKLFRNAYISFELPPKWDCKLDGTEWICRNEVSTLAKEAIIILTAKEVGPSDTVGTYENYLKAPKASTTAAGAPRMSEVKNSKRTQINGQEWVDSLHLNSEIPGYYTRYLATVKQQLAILVTMSAHQMYYTKYSSDFFKVVQSLTVVASGQLLNSQTMGQGGNESLGVPTSGMVGVDASDESAMPEEQSSDQPKQQKTLVLALLILAIGGYLFMKISKKKKDKNPFQ